MKVYLIPDDKADDWRGVYNGIGFDPVEDADGNMVVAVQADYSGFPFAGELAECDQIDFKPRNTSIV